jgi:1-deoxy-D-xylulose-5-phosphate reductoisomerase
MPAKSIQVIILGSTGSIGENAVKVIRNLNYLASRGLAKKSYKVRALIANTNWKELIKQAKDLKPYAIGLTDKKALAELKEKAGAIKSKICKSIDEINKIISAPETDIVLIAISGSEALPFTLAALKAGKILALANKEVLVMAGGIISDYARKNNIEIRPVDSEHSAIFQVLHCGGHSEVKRVIITASGGPFYNVKKNLRNITPKEALKHPTWQMGRKITIDSATLMNKALEMIEAHWLFNLKPEQIKVMIHPQSIIHSMVEFCDGSTVAQLSEPDMRIPIQFAFTYPERVLNQDVSDIWNKNCSINLLKPDKDKFLALELGYRVIKKGGTSGAVLNAANEEAVKLFINRRIKFTDIIPLVEKTLNKHKVIKNPAISQIMEADEWARGEIHKQINR